MGVDGGVVGIMQIRVLKDAAAKRLGHTQWTANKLSRNVVTPGLRDIADVLIADLKAEFSGARRYRGDMASGFRRVDISTRSVAVTQSAAHEAAIREGTKGHGPGGEYAGFPRPVVDWALFRGYSLQEAYKIAKGIQKRGWTARTFEPYHPGGEPRFEYTEWVVDKHSQDLEAWAQKIGGAVVRFVTTGDVWRARSLG